MATDKRYKKRKKKGGIIGKIIAVIVINNLKAVRKYMGLIYPNLSMSSLQNTPVIMKYWLL